ncbi:MAG TPA: Xaa-Pro peptidase family protein [Gemmatimonadales bacterium]|nr:Xaa-Pro peptidase family protein [Gemmatimonadales bacterium]
MDRRAFVAASGAALVTAAGARHSAPPSLRPAVALQEPTFSPGVFTARIDKARAALAAAKLDLLVATPSTNYEYLTGYNPGRSERLIALFLPVKGDPIIVCPAFEVERLKAHSVPADLRPWEEQKDPYDVVHDVARQLKPLHRRGQVGLEPTTTYQTLLRLTDRMDNWEFHPTEALFRQLRIVKAPEEVVMIRRAVAIIEDAIAATFAQLAAGMTERDVAATLSAEVAKRGSTGGGLVQFGTSSALPHGGPAAAALARDTVVLIDAGARVAGYTSDITRTIWWGDAPSDEFKKVFNTVHDAQTAAMQLGKPLVTHCEEMDRAARAVISTAGYGQFFTHRLGHGLGMDGHEDPYLVEGNDKPLEPGMVFTIEPGIYQLGKFGVRIEDDCVMTDSGVEVLSHRPAKF